MISFKHILITFTILSVSIWFMPVTGTYTTKEKQISCIRFLKDCTHYQNKDSDYDTIENGGIIKFGTKETFEATITAVIESVDADKTVDETLEAVALEAVGSQESADETLSSVAAFVRLLKAMDINPSTVVFERSVEIAKAVRHAYAQELKSHENDRKPNPFKEFCESKITSENNQIFHLMHDALDRETIEV